LKFVVTSLGLLIARRRNRRASQDNQTDTHHGPASNPHGLHAITCRAASACMKMRPAAEQALFRSACSGKDVTAA
jgi:hypothetical protein